MDSIELTKKLVSIPSYVDSNQNERESANYICKYLEKNLPWLKIYKQKIGNERYNIIAYNSKNPKIIISSHMDTVLASGDIKTRLKPKILNRKLYGLGAVDMKGGLACSIIATQIDNNKTPVALIFTCDEEYYFAGTKKLIQEFKSGQLPISNATKPDIVIYPEPTNFTIGYGCRGCVELEINIKGKSAHAGSPQLGINAIEKSIELVNRLKTELRQKSQKNLGFTTVNLASLNGGIGINGVIESRANAIADEATFVLDIRTASLKQNAKSISKLIKTIAREIGVKVQNINQKLDLSPYITNIKQLMNLEKAINQSGITIKYNDEFTSSGYGEFAMVGAQLGWNAINFGPGPSKKAHQIDEYVEINDIEKITEVYSNLFKLLKN